VPRRVGLGHIAQRERGCADHEIVHRELDAMLGRHPLAQREAGINLACHGRVEVRHARLGFGQPLGDDL
jgi:hypothetical protein